jgi:hypothetical protein
MIRTGWKHPRRVDVWWWMENEIYEDDGRVIIRYATISWNADGTGYYRVSVTYQHEQGLGLYCWPAFRVLADAQDFAERLLEMTPAEAMKIHGTQWPDVVL